MLGAVLRVGAICTLLGKMKKLLTCKMRVKRAAQGHAAARQRGYGLNPPNLAPGPHATTVPHCPLPPQPSSLHPSPVVRFFPDLLPIPSALLPCLISLPSFLPSPLSYSLPSFPLCSSTSGNCATSDREGGRSRGPWVTLKSPETPVGRAPYYPSAAGRPVTTRGVAWELPLSLSTSRLRKTELHLLEP